MKTGIAAIAPPVLSTLEIAEPMKGIRTAGSVTSVLGHLGGGQIIILGLLRWRIGFPRLLRAVISQGGHRACPVLRCCQPESYETRAIDTTAVRGHPNPVSSL